MNNKKMTNEDLLNAIVNMRIKTEKGSPYWADVIQRAIEHENEETESWHRSYQFGTLDDCDWNSWQLAYETSRDLKKFYTKTWGADLTEKPDKPPVKELREADKRLKKARFP